MLIDMINYLIFFVCMLVCVLAGVYIGDLRWRDKCHILLEDSERGDKTRATLGLHLEWATPDPYTNDEVCRLVSNWHTA